MIHLQAATGSPRYAFLGLHGAFLDAKSLLEIGTALAAQGDGVLVDLAGHGEALEIAASGVAYDPASLGTELWSRPDLQRWIQALPSGLPLVLLGHSLGALTAIWLAAQGPLRGRVAHVILLEPVLALDLSVPGHGEFLLGLGIELGLRQIPGKVKLRSAEECMVDGLFSFFANLFRLRLVGEAERPYRAWLGEIANRIPCEVLVGVRHHAIRNSERKFLDIGTLVGPGHLPLDRALLRVHPVRDAGHRLDTSAAALGVIAGLVRELPGRAT